MTGGNNAKPTADCNAGRDGGRSADPRAGYFEMGGEGRAPGFCGGGAGVWGRGAVEREIRQRGGSLSGGIAGGRRIFSERYEVSGARGFEHDSAGCGRPERTEISFGGVETGAGGQ